MGTEVKLLAASSWLWWEVGAGGLAGCGEMERLGSLEHPHHTLPAVWLWMHRSISLRLESFTWRCDGDYWQVEVKHERLSESLCRSLTSHGNSSDMTVGCDPGDRQTDPSKGSAVSAPA